MPRASWSHHAGAACIRVAGVAPGATVEVRPDGARAAGAAPAMAGRVITEGTEACFVPRFPFVEGTAYRVAVDGQDVSVLVRARPARPATTTVVAIHPSATVVPRNLLRLYVRFSAPMTDGVASRHVHLVDDDGRTIPDALLPGPYELWSGDRRRLTVLLDPARIKRGLVPHRESGYALETGRPFRLVVDADFPDATGAPLQAAADRRYRVGPDERSAVTPARWRLTVPPAGSRRALEVGFDRPLDHGLLARSLHIVGPDGDPVAGSAAAGAEERSWAFTPERPWAPGRHRLAVDRILEDVAGNSVARIFDRDLEADDGAEVGNGTPPPGPGPGPVASDGASPPGPVAVDFVPTGPPALR